MSGIYSKATYNPTFSLHADIKALSKATVGAILALGLVDDAVIRVGACVDLLILNCALKEPFRNTLQYHLKIRNLKTLTLVFHVET